MNIGNIEKEYNFYRPYYEELQSQVFEIIKLIKKAKLGKSAKIDIESIVLRKKKNGINIKKLKDIKNNFDEKGKYKGEEINNITDIPDIAGVRVVCYCVDDQKSLVQRLIEGIKLFDTNLWPKKIDEKKEERYKATHVDLLKNIYIKDKGNINLSCEVQVRTMLQQAWAELDEKYTPKNERPKEGESQIIEKSISDILCGCENLWTLVKSKIKIINKNNKQRYAERSGRIK